MLASARSRLITARKASSSFLLVAWVWTLCSASSLFQLIWGTCQRYQFALDHGFQEVFAATHLILEFSLRVPGNVNFAAELPFNPSQHRKQISCGQIANQQEIDIA